jgi:hypothetical protein
MDLGGIRRVKWIEKPLIGGPQGYAASAYKAFRTVSPLDFIHSGRITKRFSKVFHERPRHFYRIGILG